MTRLQRGPGTSVLEREYVYSEPPISLTDLADKYGLARSNVAGKANAGRWTEKRDEFRLRLAQKTREALSEKWVEAETAHREKILQTGAKYLDLYVKALDSGEIKVSTRDMLGVAAMMRTYLSDIKSEAVPDAVVVNPDGEVDFDSPDAARQAIEYAKRLMSGKPESDD